MSRKFIATVVAAALGVAAFGNSPARADEALARALATVVGVAVVGAIIKHQLDDDKKEKSAKRRKRSKTVEVQRGAQSPYNISRRYEARPLPARVKRKLLPGDCLRSFETRDGRLPVFTKSCLAKNYAYNNSLPGACSVKVRAHKNKYRGYDARCLRRQGYQLARW